MFGPWTKTGPSTSSLYKDILFILPQVLGQFRTFVFADDTLPFELT